MAHEHRAIGDLATGGAVVNVGGELPDERFLLGFGDVVALSGDFFEPGSASGGEDNGGLFDLARIPGDAGTRPATRDEILGALKVTTVDEAFVDPRFEPGGRFADLDFSPRVDRTDVERRVRDRYLALAANNDDHFVAPGTSTAATASGAGSALVAYRNLHQVALDVAARLGREGGDISHALAREAAAQHYLTDAFSAGHLRTPVADIRRYWKARYPGFWEHLQRRVASDTARTLRELTALIGMLPSRFVYRRTLAELSRRTSGYPELSLGDLVARCFHDWDNTHGLQVDGGGVVFGDGHVEEGVTMPLAIAAVRAGTADIQVAFELGAAGVLGEALYAAVRDATGAEGRAFLAETMVPRPSPHNAPQNWRAQDAGSLWESPMVGSTGPTVGQAIVDMLEPGGQFMRQLEGLGEGLAGSHGMFALPFVGTWLTGRCYRAFHVGFAQPLAHDPRPVILALVRDNMGGRDRGSPGEPGLRMTAPSVRPPTLCVVRSAGHEGDVRVLPGPPSPCGFLPGVGRRTGEQARIAPGEIAIALGGREERPSTARTPRSSAT